MHYIPYIRVLDHTVTNVLDLAWKMNISPKTSYKKLHRQIVKVHSLPAAGKIKMTHV